MAWTLLSLLNWTSEYFAKNHVASPRLEAEILLAHLLGLTRIKLYLNFERPMSEDELKAFKLLVQRRVKGEPVAYLTGVKEFWSLPFKVGSGVLVPRPDTERIIEIVKEMNLSPASILDVGTGSGILAIVLAKEYPAASVTAVDISPEALTYARTNAETHAVVDRIVFLDGDFKDAPLEKGLFDLIVSNPPYISSSAIPTLPDGIPQFEPRPALDGGADGLDFYRLIGERGPGLLKAGGCLIVEIGEDQGETVPEIFAQGGLKDVRLIKDHAGLPRVVVGKKE